MMRLRRSNWATRPFVFGLCVALLCGACGVRLPAAAATVRGAKTAGEAARLAVAEEAPGPLILAGWRPTAESTASTAAADTAEINFPEGEEEEHEHLYRDIGIFLVVSAFVGYFIVKAFLEGDTDEPPPPKKGKDVPGI